MSLRAKCALLLIAFELTLAVTLTLTVRHIRHYFENAADVIASSSRSNLDLISLQRLLRSELQSVEQFGLSAEAETDQRELDQRIQSTLDNLAATTQAQPQVQVQNRDFNIDALRKLIAERNAAIERHRAETTDTDRTAHPLRKFDRAPYVALDEFLVKWNSAVFDKMQTTAEGSFATLNRSIMILSINMVVAAILGVLGLILVRRWVLSPVSELTQAADEFGRGHLEHHADVRTRDELGKLADAMNAMSADLARLGRQMLFRERAAAMGELISYIAHNIRNPLAGIRSLSDSCRRNAPENSTMREQHDEIVASVERLQRWLREVEHTCRPLDIRPAPVHAETLINNIIAVFRPMADKRDVKLSKHIDAGAETLHIDEVHFEQALAAIVGNAIEATPAGGSVTIRAEVDPERRHQLISIADTGPGIPAEIRDSVFHPSVSTKREGQGLGLAMSRKIAALHAGELTFECPAQGGTIFRFDIPWPQEPDATNA